MCGRPLHEEPRTQHEQEEGEAEPAAGRPRTNATAVSFGNPDVVRAAYLPAMLAAVLGNVPILYLFCFFWYPAAGFLSVYLYRKRTGAFLPPPQGAKLGGITGLLSFTVSLLVSTVGYILGGGANFAHSLREAAERSGQPQEIQHRMMELLQNPTVVALMFMVGLAMWFIAMVGFTAIGGAVGANFLEKEK